MASNIGRILKRAIIFSNAGIAYGAFIGALNGVLAVTVLCVLGKLASVILNPRRISWWSDEWGAIVIGEIVGGMIGVAVGIAVCIPAWTIIGVAGWKGEDTRQVLQNAVRGCVRASLLMTFAGASSGVLFHTFWLYHQTSNFINSLQTSLIPLVGGFFWGSIIGCAFGLFFGAIFGARPVRSWLNVPTREMPREIRDSVLRLVQTR